MESTCLRCNTKTASTKPARYSIDDKWGAYRRISKTQSLIRKVNLG